MMGRGRFVGRGGKFCGEDDEAVSPDETQLL